MRKILLSLITFSFFAACNSDEKSNTETTKDVVGVSDSTAYKNNTMADTGHITAVPPVVTPAPPPTRRVETKVSKTTAVTKPSVSATKPKPAKMDSASLPATSSTNSTSTGTTANTPGATTTPTPAATPEKKGWSNAAKGATIGGVGGAIGGAIISKKKGKGAIIGGALGAAGGYILGRKKDKKTQAADTTGQ